MGIVDAFAAEEKIPMRFSEFHALVHTATKAELLINAVNTDVPHAYIRCMLTGKKEEPTISSVGKMADDGADNGALMPAT